MTANATPQYVQECFDAGMNDYISKPIQVEELSQALLKSHNGSNLRVDLDVDQTLNRSPIDFNVLAAFKNMVGNNAENIVADLIDCYLEDTPQLLQAMTMALDSTDQIALRQAAHTLKSSSATLGATNLAQLSKDLESLSNLDNTQSIKSKIEAIIAEFAQVKVALQTEYQLSQV